MIEVVGQSPSGVMRVRVYDNDDRIVTEIDLFNTGDNNIIVKHTSGDAFPDYLTPNEVKEYVSVCRQAAAVDRTLDHGQNSDDPTICPQCSCHGGTIGNLGRFWHPACHEAFQDEYSGLCSPDFSDI
jgi:hypothetical protein